MALIIFICEAGWFAVQTATCALAFNTLMLQFGVTFPFWLSCIIWGAVMGITAVYGVKWMSVLNYIAVPLLVILCAYGGIHAINASGWNNIASAVTENAMSMPVAISTVIGLFALGATCNADYTRYAKTRGDVVKATLLGVMPAALLMILVGAIMAIGTGNYDVTAMFAGLGLPIIAMLVLILATWTTNTGNAYMSGLAACKMFSVKDSKRPFVTLLCAVLGIVLAIIGLADFLNTYIGILGAVVPPVMGVVICDYFVICKGKKENWSPVRGVNWIGVISWLIGGIFALLEEGYFDHELGRRVNTNNEPLARKVMEDEGLRKALLACPDKNIEVRPGPNGTHMLKVYVINPEGLRSTWPVCAIDNDYEYEIKNPDEIRQLFYPPFERLLAVTYAVCEAVANAKL